MCDEEEMARQAKQHAIAEIVDQQPHDPKLWLLVDEAFSTGPDVTDEQRAMLWEGLRLLLAAGPPPAEWVASAGRQARAWINVAEHARRRAADALDATRHRVAEEVLVNPRLVR